MEDPKLEFYSEEEIEKIIRNKEVLYFADDGIDEVIVREEDIADFIMLVNKIEDYSANLKFYRKGSENFEPVLTTMGHYLDKAEPMLRDKIIDRLVALQTGESEVKEFKVIVEDMYEKVESNIEMNEISDNKDNTKNITRLEFLNEIKQMIEHNVMCYSNNYLLNEPKTGYENEFSIEKQKLNLIEQMIKEEKQKEKKKDKNGRGAR